GGTFAGGLAGGPHPAARSVRGPWRPGGICGDDDPASRRWPNDVAPAGRPLRCSQRNCVRRRRRSLGVRDNSGDQRARHGRVQHGPLPGVRARFVWPGAHHHSAWVCRGLRGGGRGGGDRDARCCRALGNGRRATLELFVICSGAMCGDALDDRARLFQLMIELGFDRSETQVYGVVLTCGPLPKRAIVSMLSGVSTEVGSALRQLQGRGLVGGVYRRLRRHQYYSINPHISLEAPGSASVLGTAFAIGAANTAPSATEDQTHTRRRICDEIAEVGSRLYRPYPAALAHQEWDAATAEEFAQLICEAMGQARQT